MTTTSIPFIKMVGTGNDFLIVDTRRGRTPNRRSSWPDLARAMCDRHYGVGADGLLVVEPSRKATAIMRIFNADGSEAEMCGNGARCVAAYLAGSPPWSAARAAKPRRVSLQTQAGVLNAEVAGSIVKIRMSVPKDLSLGRSVAVNGRPLTLGFVNTGVPHAVVAVPDLDAVDVPGLGRQLRHHEAFGPRGTNVDFIQTVPSSPNRLQIRTYERGVEGETLACGTGVTAAAVVHAASHSARSRQDGNGRARQRIEVQTRSGETLLVHVSLEGHTVSEVILEGPVRWVCRGAFPWKSRGRGR